MMKNKHLQRFLSYLISFVLILSMLPETIFSASYESLSENVSWAFDTDTGILYIEGQGSIPDFESYEDTPWNGVREEILHIELGEGITSVGKSAFYGSSKLQSVAMPASLEGIGASALAYCPNLEEINIPENVSYIGMGAFSNDSSVTSITVNENNQHFCSDDGVLYNSDKTRLIAYPTGKNANTFTIADSTVAIDAFAFFANPYLESLYAGVNLSDIGAYAFAYTPELTEVYFSGTETMWSFVTIGTGAFDGAGSSADGCYVYYSAVPSDTYSGKCGDNLTWHLDVETGVLSIDGEGEMYDYEPTKVPWMKVRDYVVKVKFGKNVTLICDAPFPYFGYIEEFIVHPDNPSYTSSDDVLFSKNMTTLIAYPANKQGSSYDIPDTVGIIDSYAFSDNEYLEQIDIPLDIYEIKDHAFVYAIHLTTINYDGPERMWAGIEFGKYLYIGTGTDTEAGEATIYFGTTVEPTYTGECGENLTWTIDTSACTLTISGEGEMYDYENTILPWWRYRFFAITLHIGSGVTKLGDWAFRNMNPIAIVKFADPSTLHTIGEGAFYGCASLAIITLPGGLKNIEDYAFALCSSLSALTIPSGTEKIGNYAFYGCQTMTSLTIYPGIKSIGESAFADCLLLQYLNYFGPGVEWGYIQKGKDWDKNAGANTSNGKYTLSCSGSGPDTDTPTFGECGENVVWNFDYLTGKLIISGTGAIDDYRAVVSPPPWEVWEDYITSIEVMEGIEIIGEDAFCLMQNVKSIRLAPSVKEIKSGAISICDSLTDIYLSEGLLTIGAGAFSSCKSLKTINIPASVTSIDSTAFSDCRVLTDIYVSEESESYASIGGVLFNKTITTLVKYPQGRTIKEYTIPDTVTYVGPSSFADCVVLEKVNLPSGLKHLGESSFSGCTSLKSIDIPKGTINIYASALAYCSSLKTVSIPNSVEKIYYNAFGYCYNLETIQFASSETKWGKVTKASGWDQQAGRDTANGTYTVTYGTDSDYFGYCGDNVAWELWPETGLLKITGTGEMNGKHPSYWTTYKNQILKVEMSEGITSIMPNAFEDMTKLASINIPSTVTSIGNSAFDGCTSLTKITLPEGLTTIGSSAFYGCSSLESINIPSTVTSIGGSAFYNCTSWKGSITIPDGVTEIPNYTFYRCFYLEEINLPNTLKSIGTQAFYNCGYLEEIKLPEGLETIDSSAFTYCNVLTSITIPSSVTSIGDSAFSNCTKLETAVVNANITTIPTGMFYNCTSLKTVALPEGLTTVKKNAFRGCTNLYDINLPNSLLTIEDYAFASCSSLKEITIPEKITTISTGTFLSCSALSEVTIPKSVTSIGDAAFSGCTLLADLYYGGNEVTWLAVTKGTNWAKDAGKNTTNKTYTIHYNEDNPTTGVCGKNLVWTYSKDDKTLTITGSGDMDNWYEQSKLPWYIYIDEIETFVVKQGVTSIGSYAMYQCTTLKKVVADEGVKRIESSAFSDCTSLTEITLGEGLLYIESDAFSQCRKLTEVKLPQGLEAIGVNSFYYCTGLKNITIPSSVKQIISGAFTNCLYLENIYFEGNTRQWNSVSKMTGWDQNAGKNTANGKYTLHIMGPDASGTCGKNLTWEYRSATETLKISGTGAMNTWSDSKSVPWSGYSKITTVEIAEGVTTIGNYAFQNFIKLSEVSLPSTLSQIGEYSFYGCTSLSEINYGASQKTWNNIYFGKSWDYNAGYSTANMTYTVNYTDNMQGQCGENVTWMYVFDDGHLVIDGEGEMYDWTSSNPAPWYKYKDNIRSLYVGGKVRNIGNYAFKDIAFTEFIEVYEGIISIGDSAFENCSYIPAVYLPKTLENIGENAFSGCINLSEIHYPSKTVKWNEIEKGENWDYNAGRKTANGTYTLYPVEEKIYKGNFGSNITWELYEEQMKLVLTGSGAMSSQYVSNNIPWYSYRHLIKSVEFDNRITSVGQYAFYNCTNLESVAFSTGITKIEDRAFMGCSSLNGVTLPNSLTTIASNAFRDCTSLDEIIVPESVTSLGTYAFSGCTSMKNAIVSTKCSYTNTYLFYNCTGLESVTIGEGITKISQATFKNCTALKEVYLPKSLTIIDKEAFYDCKNLANIYFAGNQNAWNAITKNTNWAYNAGKSTSKGTYTVNYGEENYLSGTCGDNITWIYWEKNKTLEISGNGEMTNWTSSSSVPWYSCSRAIETIVIDGEITNVGNYAFFYCSSLKNISLPESISVIGTYAFAYCSSLKSINLPKGLTSIGSSAFFSCSALSDVYYAGNEISWGNVANSSSWNCGVTIHFGEENPTSGKVNDAIFWAFSPETKTLEITGEGEIQYYNSPEEAPWYYYKNEIETVVFGDGVKNAPSYGFYQYPALMSASFGKGFEHVSSYTFYKCPQLSEISFPHGTKILYSESFYFCENLTNVYLPASISDISRDTFRGCRYLENIYYAGTEDMWKNVRKGNSWDFAAGATTSNFKYTLHYSSGSSIELSSDKVKVEIAPKTSATLLVVSYDGQKIVDTKTVNITKSSEVSLASDGLGLEFSKGNTIKAFLWDGIDGISPVCEEKSITA
ncbi:MAG: leucine-rich repeat protein [Clostridia bacterium]|nr:leucine-rich repeat protein [Clostridia bacterium]